MRNQCDERTRASVSTNFRCSALQCGFVRPNSFGRRELPSHRQFYHAYKYTRYTSALPIAVDFQPAALHLSKYRLTLRATLLVWPRTSPLIISHGLSLSDPVPLSFSRLAVLFSSIPSFHRFRRETHPSYARRSARRTRANHQLLFLQRRVFQALHPLRRAPTAQKYGVPWPLRA